MIKVQSVGDEEKKATRSSILSRTRNDETREMSPFLRIITRFIALAVPHFHCFPACVTISLTCRTGLAKGRLWPVLCASLVYWDKQETNRNTGKSP